MMVPGIGKPHEPMRRTLLSTGQMAPVGEVSVAMCRELFRRGPDSTGFAVYGTPQDGALVVRIDLERDDVGAGAEEVVRAAECATLQIGGLAPLDFFRGEPVLHDLSHLVEERRVYLVGVRWTRDGESDPLPGPIERGDIERCLNRIAQPFLHANARRQPAAVSPRPCPRSRPGSPVARA